VRGREVSVILRIPAYVSDSAVPETDQVLRRGAADRDVVDTDAHRSRGAGADEGDRHGQPAKAVELTSRQRRR